VQGEIGLDPSGHRLAETAIAGKAIAVENGRSGDLEPCCRATRARQLEDEIAERLRRSDRGALLAWRGRSGAG
jgi:hypothetical protein